MSLPDDFLEQLRSVYPKRDGAQGWNKVRALVPRAIDAGHTWETILAGATNYGRHCMRTGKAGTEYVQQARTFFGREDWFTEWAEMDPRMPSEIAAEKRMAALVSRGTSAGFRKPGATETPEQYESSLKDFERSKSTGLGAPKFQVVR